MIDAVRTFKRMREAWDVKPSGFILQQLIMLTNVLWTGKRRSVLLALADQARPTWDWWTPDRGTPISSTWQESISTAAGCDRRTVQRMLAQVTPEDVGLIEVEERPGQAARYRFNVDKWWELGEDVVTSSREQLDQKRARWKAATRQQIPIEMPEFPAPPEDSEANDANLAWMDELIRRVTGEAPSAPDRELLGGCWRKLGLGQDEMRAQLHVVLTAVEDSCQSYAFRWLRGEVPFDDGRPSVDHRRETRHLFAARWWRIRVDEARAHATGKCGCFDAARSLPPPTDAPIRRRYAKPRPARVAADPHVTWFGEGLPPTLARLNPNEWWSGALSRLRAQIGKFEVATWLEDVTIRVGRDAVEVVFTESDVGREKHAYVVATHADRLIALLGCRFGLSPPAV